MAVTGGTSNQTKFFSSGSISARGLKDTFNGNAGNTNIKFSTYRRDTDLDETDPIVPDSTENRTTISASEGISTNNDLKASSFRNSIKQYVVTQSSTNSKLNIHTGSAAGQRWNDNLDKNVKKFFNVNGTIDSDSPGSRAAQFTEEAYNLTIDVTGNIYGEGGEGGSQFNNGGDGGTALFLNNTSTRSGNSAKVTVKVNSSGRIWAGGGGGAGGNSGNSGSSLSCYSDSISAQNVYSGGSTNPQRGCKGCPGISGVTLVSNGNCGNNSGNRSRCRQRQERGQTCTNSYFRNCVYRTNFTVAGGNGGSGGNGGVGEGANNNQGSGNSGNAGNTNNCAVNGNTSTGNSGNDGAAGGTWGEDGGNSVNLSGGTKGFAVLKGATGNTFFLNGQSANNVKGTVSGKV